MDEQDSFEEEPRLPRGWSRHPPEKMLITPWIAGLGGLTVFLFVVFVVVWLPVHTFDPPASADWAPLSDQATKGRHLFARNNCFVCHSGYSRPQDVRQALYFLYPKVSQPGDFYGSDQSPNLLGTERTGPDLSQESGWHPDDWQFAHFYDARFTDPLSLMPPMRSLFSNRQVEQLTRFVETRSGKSGLLRYAGQLYAKRVVTTVQGFPQPYRGFRGAHKPIVEQTESEPPPNQLEEAPNLSQIDRSYWLSGDPLPATEGNLLRGKEVFLQRCVGCHGTKGDGKGPGARFFSPPPADFTDKDDACCGGDTGPGDFYFRILRGWTGTGMENFGERLSVDDIWRVVLFVKTIPNKTLREDVVPEPKDYITWQRRRRARTRSCRRRCACSRGLTQRTGSWSTGSERRSASRTRRPGSGRSTTACWVGRGRTPSAAATSCPRPRRGTFPRPYPASNEAPADNGLPRARRGACDARGRARARPA